MADKNVLQKRQKMPRDDANEYVTQSGMRLVLPRAIKASGDTKSVCGETAEGSAEASSARTRYSNFLRCHRGDYQAKYPDLVWRDLVKIISVDYKKISRKLKNVYAKIDRAHFKGLTGSTPKPRENTPLDGTSITSTESHASSEIRTRQDASLVPSTPWLLGDADADALIQTDNNPLASLAPPAFSVFDQSITHQFHQFQQFQHTLQTLALAQAQVQSQVTNMMHTATLSLVFSPLDPAYASNLRCFGDIQEWQLRCSQIAAHSITLPDQFQQAQQIQPSEFNTVVGPASNSPQSSIATIPSIRNTIETALTGSQLSESPEQLAARCATESIAIPKPVSNTSEVFPKPASFTQCHTKPAAILKPRSLDQSVLKLPVPASSVGMLSDSSNNLERVSVVESDVVSLPRASSATRAYDEVAKISSLKKSPSSKFTAFLEATIFAQMDDTHNVGICKSRSFEAGCQFDANADAGVPV